MAISANVSTSYELANYDSILSAVIARAEEEVNKTKGGAAQLRADVHNALRTSNFVGRFQVAKPAEHGRLMTFDELFNSYKYETTAQLIDPSAVEKILFGPDGLIRRAGGGRAPYLMEDIEVGFIVDAISGDVQGPIITSGRNRTLALQIMLRACGVQPAAIRDLAIRVSVIKVRSAEEIQRRIISANTGSRDFSRAEVRERLGATSGVTLLDRSTIAETISLAKNERAFKAALGAWLKDAAIGASLNTLTPSQYSDAGNTLFNNLAKKNKPDGKTFYGWLKADTTRFVRLAQAADQSLPLAVAQVAASKAAGPMSTKLANALTPLVAAACSLAS